MSSLATSSAGGAPEHCPVARVDDRAWSILCGVEGCSETLAACGWLDVQFYMILNSTNDEAAEKALARLPRPQYRTYRLCVEFLMGWRRGVDGVWRDGGSGMRRLQRMGQADPLSERIINGRLTSNAHHQEAEPPAYAECPRCGTVNVIQRQQRIGIPGYAESPGGG